MAGPSLYKRAADGRDIIVSWNASGIFSIDAG